MRPLTVAEIIETLIHEDPNTVVALAYPYGDYCGRTAVRTVDRVDTVRVGISDYMQGLEYREDGDYDGDEQTVVLLF